MAEASNTNMVNADLTRQAQQKREQPRAVVTFAEGALTAVYRRWPTVGKDLERRTEWKRQRFRSGG